MIVLQTATDCSYLQVVKCIGIVLIYLEKKMDQIGQVSFTLLLKGLKWKQNERKKHKKLFEGDDKYLDDNSWLLITYQLIFLNVDNVMFFPKNYLFKLPILPFICSCLLLIVFTSVRTFSTSPFDNLGSSNFIALLLPTAEV